MLEHFAIAVAAHVAVDVSKAALTAAFNHVKRIRPQLETELQSATTPKEIEKVFQEAVGVIIAEANDGKIEIDGATMSALRGIKFDHQHGTVTIGDAVIAAETLITGGSAGATGTTDIKGNTRLASKGTAIEVGKGAAIKITGGAKIKQT